MKRLNALLLGARCLDLVQYGKPIHVLLVEDSRVQAELFAESLALDSGTIFKLDIAADLATGIAKLGSAPDVIVTDLGLPDAEGLMAVQRFVEHAPLLPLVVISAHRDEALALAAMDAGAQDYIVKGLHAPALIPRIVMQAIERKELYERVRQQNEDTQAFASALTHDLLGSLFAIRHIGDQIRRDLDEPQLVAAGDRVSPLLAHLNTLTEQMHGFIQDILVLADLRDGEPDERPVTLNSTVQSVTGRLAREAESRGLLIRYDLHPEAVVRGNAMQIRHLVYNLVENAIKHSRDNGGEVVIRARLDGPPPTDAVVFEVEDNGPGVPEYERERVFRAFQRGAGAHATRGHGLGLAIASRAAKNHDAAIRILDAPGGGALFRVVFPGSRAVAPAQSAGGLHSTALGGLSDSSGATTG